MIKWLGKYKKASTTTWGTDWSYIKKTHSTADYEVIKKEL